MSSRFSHSSGLTKIIIIVEFALVGYLVYSLTKNVYNGYQVDKYIEEFETKNAQIELENRQKTDDYLYFTSDEYIDKIAKQNLGLVNPGEEILVLSNDVLVEESSFDVVEEDSSFAKFTGGSVFSQWVEFFFE